MKIILLVFITMLVSFCNYARQNADSSYYTRAFEYFDALRYDSACKYFTLSIRGSYKIAKSYMFRGESKMALGDLRSGKLDLDTAYRLDSSNVYLSFLFGRYYYYVSQYEISIQYYQQAVSGNPGKAAYPDGLAMAYLRIGKLSSALKYSNQAIRLDPADASYYNNRGMIQLAMSAYDEAIADFNECLRRTPEDLVAKCNIAACLLRSGKLNEALQTCNEVLQRKSDMSYGLLVRGETYYALNDKDNACKDYRKLSESPGEFQRIGDEFIKKHCQ